MSNPYRTSGIEVPDSLARQLTRYRRRVWQQKLGEAVLLAACVLLVAWLVVWTLERFGDTPSTLRSGVLLIVVAVGAAIPWCIYRWVYGRRRLVQLARLLRRRMPRLGDALLGVFELADDRAEQARSEALCAAAMAQVAEQARQVDLSHALPHSRLRAWAVGAGIAATCVLVLAIGFPQATANAWTRLLLPWSDVPRYTLTAIQPLPETIVVAHGEPFAVEATLEESSRWRPQTATARVDGWPPVEAKRTDGVYRFVLSPLRQETDVRLQIGDLHETIRVTPMLRPELQRIVARIRLPAYLQRAEAVERDLGGGAISVLAGSRLQLIATANRPLAEALFQQRPIAVDSATFATPEIEVTSDQTLTLRWVDRHGLTGAQPLETSVAIAEDRPPTVSARHLPSEQLLLITATLPLKLVAQDDYGVRRVGFQWRRLDETGDAASVISGERYLAAGGPAVETLAADGVFTASQLGISPGPIELRLFVEDYRPSAARVTSKPYRLTFLTPAQHAAWLGDQLHRWHQQALDLRDRELQLYEGNRKLRELPPEALDRPETRRRIRQQAAAERVSAARLERISSEGAELIHAAVSNPSINAAQLQQWASMLTTLKQIATQRMPAVAELLETSAAAPVSSEVSEPEATNPQARPLQRPGAPSKPPTQSPFQSSVQSPSQPPSQSTAAAPLNDAVEQQQELLAEFQRLAGEIHAILANLEGSTLVKRLKAESQQQLDLADQINDQLEATFGRQAESLAEIDQKTLAALARRQRVASEQVAQVIDDMQAYLARRPLPRFQAVLNEMRASDVVGSLRASARQIDDNQGATLAMAEYWADALDRWANSLVDPASSSSSPGGESADSLPPEVVLEALRILQAEVDLREATRVAEQSRPVVEADAYRREAIDLAESQSAIVGRVEQLVRAIALRPGGPGMFQRELSLLDGVRKAMNDAAAILARPETGMAAIAAETEAIERLLQSRQINPGGGSGGDAPGGGDGQGVADAIAALLSSGSDLRPRRQPSEAVQATGAAGVSLPAEYRAGLDRYFSRLEAAVQSQP